MFNSIKNWLTYMWRGQEPTRELLQAYQVTFQNQHGAIVLQHLLDEIYCTVYNGTDPNEAIAHNARRSVVHEILVNIDGATRPGKYETNVEDRIRELEERRRNGVV